MGQNQVSTVVHIEELSGHGFDETILGQVRATRSKISNGLADQIEAQFGNQGHIAPHAGTVADRINMEATTLRFDRDAELFKLAGSSEADGAA